MENAHNSNFENELSEQIKYNKIRTQIWKLASENSSNNIVLIQDLLNIIGPALNVSRACYNEFTVIRKKSYFICTMEWCEERVKPSIGTKLPASMVKYFISGSFFVLNIQTAVNAIPIALRTIFKPVIQAYAKSLNLDSVFLMPYFVKDNIKGILTFDICDDKKEKPVWTEERKNIIFDFVNIASACVTKSIIEEELKESENRLRQAEKMNAIGQLAGGIAHDFNNQMTGIMGYADLIRKKAVPDSKILYYAENIATAVRRATDLTEKLMTFARKGPNILIQSDIHKIINEVITFLNHSINKNISITKKFNAKQYTINGDPSQLQNMFLNIGLNARDAMPNGVEFLLERI